MSNADPGKEILDRISTAAYPIVRRSAGIPGSDVVVTWSANRILLNMEREKC